MSFKGRHCFEVVSYIAFGLPISQRREDSPVSDPFNTVIPRHIIRKARSAHVVPDVFLSRTRSAPAPSSCRNVGLSSAELTVVSVTQLPSRVILPHLILSPFLDADIQTKK